MKTQLILLLFLCNTIYSQKNYFELRTFKKSEIPSIEKKFNSKKYKDRQKRIYTGEESNLSQPICYARNATDNLPAANVQYIYSEKDRLVKSITFYWKLNIDKKLSQGSKVEKYNIAFDNLIKSLSTILGDPNPNQGNLTEMESPVDDDKTLNYKRKVIWKINSKTITTLIVWAEGHGQAMSTTIK